MPIIPWGDSLSISISSPDLLILFCFFSKGMSCTSFHLFKNICFALWDFFQFA